MATVVVPLEPVGRALRATATLSFVSGFVDVVGFVALSGLFASYITGNLTSIGSDIVHSDPGIWPKLLALPTFVVFVVITRFVVLHYDHQEKSPLRVLLVGQAVLLAACMVAGIRFSPFADPETSGAILTGMLGVSAMAVQNGYARLTFAAHPSTTIMTTNAAQAVVDLVDMWRGSPKVSGPARDRFAHTGPMIFAFIVGSISGAYCYLALSFVALTVPIVALLVLIWIAPTAKVATN